MHEVVPTAVRKAVRAATTTFTAISMKRFFIRYTPLRLVTAARFLGWRVGFLVNENFIKAKTHENTKSNGGHKHGKMPTPIDKLTQIYTTV